MIPFVLRRIGQAVLVMLAVAFIAFSASNYIGDPVAFMVGIDTPPDEREKLRVELGLDDPVPVRFARFVGNVVQGEFGRSYRVNEPVAPLILARLPATLELSLVAAVLAMVLGIGMGIYTGLHPDSLLSRVFMTVSLVGISLPVFLVGILFIAVFAVLLGWLPSYGRGEVVDLGWWSTGLLTLSGWKAMIMPAITLGLFQMTLIMRLVRSEILEVLRTDYIKFARARGLSERAVNYAHALKNALMPVITVTGMQLGTIIAFAIVTETVFSWPGMGQLFLQSVQYADVPVIAAYLVLVAFIFVVINLVVDMLYFVIDPRLGSVGGRH